MTGGKYDDGYSLIELVVALLLLSMIAMLTQSGLFFGTRVWEKTETRIESGEHLIQAQVVLREVLSQSLPHMKDDFVTFSGRSDRVVFDCVPPQAFEQYGSAHVVISSEPSAPAKRKLILRMQSLAKSSTSRELTLGDDFGRLRFTYLDATDRSATWLAAWHDRKSLPAAVRITSDDPAHWPELTIHLQIMQDPNCFLDPVSMTCRRT
jgi:prepilin-type N-terminal cleavage/methylation domain-containing protein